ncbi:nicotinate-nucleotide--dimethylbenzimidazole phosphoribosyltransferase [Streptomyces sp. NPDC060048]|uniref:nicotinate-nucleotide--dimethylbenzimidazole phosphoribosyltransferase n=1 Tax=unclassified Streptomyces TaxID=2593676 RepID=UPI0036890893
MTDTGQVPGEGLPDSTGVVDQPGFPAPVPVPAPGGYAFQDLVDDPAGPEDEELLLMPSSQGAWSDPQVVPPVPAFPEPAPYADAPYAEYPAVGEYQQQAAPVSYETAGYAPQSFPEQSFSEPFPPQPSFPDPASYSAGAHEAGGRDSGALDLGGLVAPQAQAPAAPAAPAPVRRPLHMGPPVPDAGGGVVRSLADRGPAAPPAPAPAPAQAPAEVPAAQPAAEHFGSVPPAAVHRSEPPAAEPEYLDLSRAEIPVQAGTPWTEQAPEAVAAPEPAAPAEPEAQPEAEPVRPEVQPVAFTEPETQAEAQPETQAEAQPVALTAPDPEAGPDASAEPEPIALAEHETQPAAPAVAEPEPVLVAVAEPEAGVEPVAVAVAEPAVAEPVAEPVAAGAPEAVVVPAPEPQPVAEPQPQPAEAVVQAAGTAPEPAAEPVAAAPLDAGTASDDATAPQARPEPAAAPAPEAEPEGASEPETGPAAGEPAPAYADAEREAVLRVMRERRDIRKGFRSDPIPHEVLLRVLEAAHTAPSVGHSQPWDFVVIKSAETRRTMHELAEHQREAYAKSLPKGRAKQFKELKIEAILDTPVNIVVTADPTRGGRHTLGRHTQPQMAPYSSALAVENLWLAARAEGLGVGWVSFFDEREMVRALGLPEHLEVVAYLCVGYVDEFPEEPELAQAGWSQRRPLSWVVHEETYGRRALPGEEPHDLLSETVAGIRPLDAKALGEAWERQKRMTKPAGALGMLEIISAQLAGLSRVCPPPIPEPAAVAIFAGDHGVHAQGVTPWPQEVTMQMVANFLGGGAVCNAFANQVGAEVCVIDVGVAGDLPATPGLLPRKVRPGTADLSVGPAMTREEAIAAIEVGIETARDLVAAGNKALLTGEMGIANTTVSAALISVFTGVDPAEVTGRGTGINDETHARKVEVVRRALELHQPDPADPVGVLAAIGGLEHAAIVGLLLGGASLRTPVILDGVSAGAAALVARAIAPESLSACIAGHRSAEPGHVAALNKLGLRPLVDLDLRLGEGTGALLALPLVQSAARAMHEVATFDSAGVTEK